LNRRDLSELFEPALEAGDNCQDASRFGDFCMDDLNCGCPEGGCDVEGQECLEAIPEGDECGQEGSDQECEEGTWCGCPLLGCGENPTECQPARVEDESCADSGSFCAEGFYCSNFDTTCQPEAAVGESCEQIADNIVCQDDLFCRPTFTDEGACAEVELGRTCQVPALGNNACCQVPSGPGTEDMCGDGRWCDDGEEDGVLGRCVAQADQGQQCDYCEESGSVFPSINRFTQCEEGLACVLSRDGEDYDQSCEARYSICPFQSKELYSSDEDPGVCDYTPITSREARGPQPLPPRGSQYRLLPQESPAAPEPLAGASRRPQPNRPS
jgi:hypothetical protein